MIVEPNPQCNPNDDVLAEWVCAESAAVAREVLQRMPPAVRQAMTTLDAIESGIHRLIQHIGQQVTEALIAPQERPALGVCRECGHALRLVDARRPLKIGGIFGTYHLARPYAVCPQGHGSDAPHDRALQLGPGSVSPALAAILARLAIDVPFDQVPDIIADTLGLQVDGELVRRVTEQVGTWAEGQERQAIQTLAASEPPPTVPVPGPSALLISVDGAMVHTTRAEDGHQGWHEGKVGVCARFAPCPTPENASVDEARPDYGRPEFCIGFEPRAAFMPRLYWHAVQAGLQDPTCHLVVLTADGAHWIWEEGAACLRLAGKTVVAILDFYHASQHIWAVAEAVWPDKSTREAWAEAVLHRLRHEGGAILDEVWNTLPPLTAAAAETVGKERAYFAYHASRLDYPRYRSQGWPIGSGIIESACKTVLKQRESGGGMRWTEAGAQAIATLRAVHRSGHWQAFWGSHPWAQLVPHSRRIAA